MWWRRGRCTCGDTWEGRQATRIVHLVHGTYARHAPWVQPGSALRTALEDDDSVVRVHCWSGRNTQRHRERAGRELGAAVGEAVADDPHAEHVVVAHSHGGNVALYAIRDEPSLDNVRVVTLATPFLSLSPGLRIHAFHLLPFIFALVIAPLVVVGLVTNFAENLPTAVVGITMLAGMGIIVAYIMSALREPGTGFWRAITGRNIEQRAREVTAKAPDRDRLLVICAAGDEASGLLGATQLATWIGNTMTVWAASLFWLAGWRRGLRTTATVVGAVVVIGLFNGLLGDNQLARPFAWVVFGAIAVPPVVVALGNATFGLDTLHLGLTGRIRASPVPEGAAPVAQVGALPATSGLVHGIYNHPGAIDAVRVWTKRPTAVSGRFGPTAPAENVSGSGSSARGSARTLPPPPAPALGGCDRSD